MPPLEFWLLLVCQALGETAAWFRRALSVEQIKGPLRLSGYSACGQDGGVQLPRQYVEGTLCNSSHFLEHHLDLMHFTTKCSSLTLKFVTFIFFLCCNSLIDGWKCRGSGRCRLGAFSDNSAYHRQHPGLGCGLWTWSVGPCNCW